MTEEMKYPITFKTVRLPVEIYGVSFAFQVRDEEAAKEAWRQLVKASGCSIITDPVVRDEYDIDSDKHITVIEGAVVGHPNIPGPRHLRNPSYLDICIWEDSNDRYA